MTATKGRQCRGKKAYATRGAAQAVSSWLIRHMGSLPAHVSVYRCKHCKLYHVGHRPRYKMKK